MKALPIQTVKAPRKKSLHQKEEKKPEFYVSDQYGNFFAGYKDAYPYWTPKLMEAKELTEERHFNTLVRWESGFRILKKEYLPED